MDRIGLDGMVSGWGEVQSYSVSYSANDRNGNCDIHLTIPQVLLVTGGYDGHTAQSTTEILRAGANAWVWGPLLPVYRAQLKGAHLNGAFYVIGGVDRDNQPHEEVRETSHHFF